MALCLAPFASHQSLLPLPSLEQPAFLSTACCLLDPCAPSDYLFTCCALQVVPALKALTGLLKNHSLALLGGSAKASAASTTSAATGGGKVEDMQEDNQETAAAAAAAGVAVLGGAKGTAAEAIARGVFDELHLPALSQSIRQVIQWFVRGNQSLSYETLLKCKRWYLHR